MANKHEKMLDINYYQKNGSQNYNEIPFPDGQNGHHQKLCKQNAGEGMENLSYTMVGNANWHSHYGELCGDFIKNSNRTIIQPSNSSPGHTHQENQN